MFFYAQETMEDIDKDKDGYISLDEYISKYISVQKNTWSFSDEYS